MLEGFRGVVRRIGEDFAVLEHGGVSLRFRVPAGTAAALQTGVEAGLFCHLSLRDEQFHLFGFATEGERDTFELLLTVSGLGPEKARTLLSALSPRSIAAAVAEEDPARFRAVRGIGTKIAQRLVLELRDRFDSIELGAESADASPRARFRGQNAVDLLALLARLGYPRQSAEAAAGQALETLGDTAALEALSKLALRLLQRK